MSSKKKRLEENLARKMASQVLGNLLAQAFIILRREGLSIRVATIDGKPVQAALKDHRIVNVDVVDGFVRRAWA